MRILIVASGNAKSLSPFIVDQVKALNKCDVKTDYYVIKGKGIIGYGKNYWLLINKINSFKPDIVHAHYGLSGLLAVLQRRIPVVITFHGSDINNSKARMFSKLAHKLSSKSIFVSKPLADQMEISESIIIPCGVDMDIFFPEDKTKARKELNFDSKKKYILFSSGFTNAVKNYSLAKNAISQLNSLHIELIELKGFNRMEVAKVMNAVDAVIMTSFSEGSPQFIKEAMACSTPIISTDVGDVKNVIKNTKGCFIVQATIEDVKCGIERAIEYNDKTDGRMNIKHMDNLIVASNLKGLYETILKKNKVSLK